MFRTILLEGNLCLRPDYLKNLIGKFLDCKQIDNFFRFFQKSPFFFSLSRDFFFSQTKIECRWEKFRLKILGVSILKNPQLTDVTKKILQEINKYRKKGILQHKLAKIFRLESNDVYYYLINLINFGLIEKEIANVYLNSKYSNVIILKPKFHLEYKRINPNNEYIEKSINKNTTFSLIENIVKITARIEKNIKQKKIKYGVLSFYKNLDKNYKKKIHRIWRKAKEKCYKAKLYFILPSFKVIFREKHSNCVTASFDYRKENKMDNFNLEKSIWQLISIFYVHPEIHIWKILLFNKNKNITSPMLLDVFRGYINYKTVQLILKNLEKFKGICKRLEQIGRQKIMHFYFRQINFSKEKNRVFSKKKIIKRVTEQVMNRRIALLTWTKNQLVNLKELGKKFANFENKGLKKIDSKVVRRVLSDLINFGYIKIIKIYIQLNLTKTKIFEFVVEKNCQDFYPEKISKISLNLSTKKNFKYNKFEKKKKFHQLKMFSVEVSLYFWCFKYKFSCSNNFFVFPMNLILKDLNFKKSIKFDYFSINYESNILKNRFFFLNNRYELFQLIPASIFEKKNIHCHFYKKEKLEYFLSKFFLFKFDLYQKISFRGKNFDKFLVLKNWKKNSQFQIKNILKTKTRIIHCKFFKKKDNFTVRKKITCKDEVKLNKFETNIFMWEEIKILFFDFNFKQKEPNKKQENFITDHIEKYDVFKCKWDSELDIKLYNQFLFDKKISKNNVKKFKEKFLKRRIKSLSIISNIKIASIFFGKCLKIKETQFFFNSFLYFYQIVKRSLELPNDSFFLNIQKTKKFSNQLKKKLENFTPKNIQVISKCVIKNINLKIHILHIKINFSSMSTFFTANFIFLCKKHIYIKKKKFMGYIFGYLKNFKIDNKDNIILTCFYLSVVSFWQKKSKSYIKNYNKLECENILNMSSIKKQIFLCKLDTYRLNLSPFFVKNCFYLKNNKFKLNKKIIPKISNMIEARIFFYNFHFISNEKSWVFWIENEAKKVSSAYLIKNKIKYYNLDNLKKDIFHLINIFENFFGFSVNFYLNEISINIEKLLHEARNFSRFFDIRLYLIIWEFYNYLICLLIKKNIYVEVIISKIGSKNNIFLPRNILHIRKYILFCFFFSNPGIEKNNLLFKIAKYFSDFVFENLSKLLFYEDRVSWFQVCGKSNSNFPFIIPRVFLNDIDKYVGIFKTIFIQPKIEHLID